MSAPGASFPGIYRAMVTNANDPVGEGRVQVHVPSMMVAGAWAPPCGDYKGVTKPPVGATVWIMYEGGDPSRPVWMGCWPGK